MALVNVGGGIAANAGGITYSGGTRRVRDIPPLRPDPWTQDDATLDGQRADYVIGSYHSQDGLLRQRDRMVEENIRILAGQHWILWSERRQRFVDLSEYFIDDEKRWRQLPVLHRIMLWFMLLKARCTENPPVLSFLPGPDRVDAQLAEVFDPVFKYLWNEVNMLGVLDRMFTWLIPTGRTFIKSRIDPNKGDLVEYVGPALLQLLNADGSPVLRDGQPIQRIAEQAPYDAEGRPLAELVESETGEIGWRRTGDPYAAPGGFLVPEVLTCLEVRGEWGPMVWDDKAWHCQRSFLTPEQFYAMYGFEVEPDITGARAEEVSIIMKVLYGSGMFRAADNRRDSWLTEQATYEYVSVYEFWHAPRNFLGMQKTSASPGGRLSVVTGSRKVIRDGVRPLPFEWTSPIRAFGFVDLPGRPQETSPQEMLNSAIRSRNRMVGQVIEHATKVSNPIMLYDKNAGIDESKISGRPGARIGANLQGLTQTPIQFVSPAPISRDIYKALEILTTEFDELGNMRGTEGAPPTRDASGELVKELRFNADRFIGPTLRNASLVIARMAADWKLLIPVMWDRQKLISIAGEDQITRTLTLMPEYFLKGRVNIVPDVESMLPESRQERQARIRQLYAEAVFGPPGTPEAINTYLELARFPHLGRLSRLGGPDRSMAERNTGELLQGAQATDIPIFEWYDFAIHVGVLERFMKGPEFVRQSVAVQQQMVIYRQLLLMAQQMAAQQQLMREMQQAGAEAEASAIVGAAGANVAQRLAPPEIGPGAPPGPPERGATRGIPSGAGAAA